jgi:uncharacterized membrane protein YfbV (UPF0208 family)
MGKIFKGNIKIFLLILAILSISFSQNTQLNIEGIVQTLIGIGVLLAIILVLLYLAGILKFRGVGGSAIMWIVYGSILIIVFVLPLLQRLGYIHIFPDKIDGETLKRWGFPQANRFPESICSVLKMLTLQEEVACYMPEFLFLVILPFTAIFAISYGFLHMLNIFKGVPNEEGIYRLLAFIMAFSTIPMGIFMILIAFWFSFMGTFSVAVFVAMFVLGVFFRGYGFVSKEYTRAIQTSMKIRSELKKLLLEGLAALKGKGVDEKYEKLAEILERDTVKQFFSRNEIEKFKEELSKIDRRQQDANDKINNLIDKIMSTLEKKR